MPALEPGSDADRRSDADLIHAIREGDATAIDVLFSRHHRAALCFAESIAGRTLAPDLVSDAFLRILDLLKREGGPTVFFRSYLYTTIRNLYIDHVRHHARQTSLPDFTPLEAEFALGDGIDDHFEHSLVKRAFSSLPERWQVALWYTTVEGVGLEDAGRFLGVAPNAVAALTFRAREGLRQAYLAEHLSQDCEQTCNEFWDVLPKYVRGTLRDRMRQSVEEHLEGCRACTAAVIELGEVNAGLRGVLVVALLGSTTAGYLEHALGPVQPTVAATGSRSLLTHSIGRVATVVATVAAVGVLVLTWPHHDTASTETADAVPPSMLTLSPDLPSPAGPTTGRPAAPRPTLAVRPLLTSRPTESITPGSSPVTVRPAVALGSSWNQLTRTTPSWYHVGIAIGASAVAPTDLSVSIEAHAWSALHVHREAGYGPWLCIEVQRGSRLRCHLPPGTSGPLDLGLDVQLAHPITLEVTVTPATGARSVTDVVVG